MSTASKGYMETHLYFLTIWTGFPLLIIFSIIQVKHEHILLVKIKIFQSKLKSPWPLQLIVVPFPLLRRPTFMCLEQILTDLLLHIYIYVYP